MEDLNRKVVSRFLAVCRPLPSANNPSSYGIRRYKILVSFITVGSFSYEASDVVAGHKQLGNSA